MKKSGRVTATAAALVCLTLWIGEAHAAQASPCDREVNTRIGKKLGIENFSPDGAILASACKVWPKDDSTLIAAHVYRRKHFGGTEALDLLVTFSKQEQDYWAYALYDRELARNAALRIEQGDVSIDTARYNLTGTERAFGVRIAGLVGKDTNEYVTLFVEGMGRLEPILEDIPTSGVNLMHGAPVRYKTSISMGENSHNGWKDVVLNTTYFVTGEDGKETVRDKKTTTMVYNGNWTYVDAAAKTDAKTLSCACPEQKREYKACPDGGYFVIYPETVSYFDSLEHYYHGCGGGYPSLHDYCSSAGVTPRYSLLGAGLPAPKYSRVKVFFSKESQASRFQQSIPGEVGRGSEYDFSNDWRVEVRYAIANVDREVIRREIEQGAPDALGIEFEAADAIITFGGCLSKNEAEKLAHEVNKTTGITPRVLFLHRMEWDL